MATNSHAKFSASASHRWMHCPGSISLSEKAPPSRESSYALEGTNAHLCLEMILKNPHKQLSTEALLRKTYPTQMIMDAVNAAKIIYDESPMGGVLFSETKSDLSYIHPDMWGTTDAVIVEEFGRLTVIDYKYGAGIPVDPENNSQLIFYALGISKKYHHNFSEVCLMIIQPRAEHERGPVRKCVIPMHELLEWETRFKNAIEVALDKKPPFASGNHCRFCPATSICPILSEQALATAQIDFALETPDQLKLPYMKDMTLTPEWVGKALDSIELIETWIEGFKAMAFLEAEAGRTPKGYKLVGKRGTRKWNDAAKVAKLAQKTFGEQAFSRPELLSPAQLEKIGADSKEFVAKHSTNVSSGVTLVSENDPRQAVNQIELDFMPSEMISTGPEQVVVSNSKSKTKKGK